MISSTATYALRAVVYLAGQPDRFVTRAEVSEAAAVPYEYLLKVLHQLDAAGFVASRSGPHGGYRLRKSADKISARQIVLAVGVVSKSECPLGNPDHKQLCLLQKLLDETNQLVEATLAETKISDLLPGRSPQKCDQSRKKRKK